MGSINFVQCIRPQCGKLYKASEIGKYCICGATLQRYEKENKTIDKHSSSISIDQTTKAILVLVLEDDSEVKYDLGRENIIGINTDRNVVEIDLSPYADRTIISRKHAVIYLEDNTFYIRKMSKRFSVHVNEKAVDKSPIKLISGDMILLSKKILFQFEEV